MLKIQRCVIEINYILKYIKGLVQPEMKISPCFTHPQAILGVYDFLLSDESNRSNFQNCPGSSKLYHCSQRVFLLHSPKHVKKNLRIH